MFGTPEVQQQIIQNSVSGQLSKPNSEKESLKCK